MKIAFAGAGAVGCHYGAKLQQAGFEVLLLARGAHLAALQSGGLLHESEGGEMRLQVLATDDVGAIPGCDVVVLCCKMTGLEAMLASLSGHIGENALIVTLQNGVEAADMVAEYFPAQAVAAGTAFIGARLEAPGHVIHSAAGGVRMGLWRHGAGERQFGTLVDAFNSAGVPARLDDDPAAMLWRKLLWNIGFNAITAITRRYAKEMAADSETLAIVTEAMQEAVAVAHAMHISIGNRDIEKHIEVTLAMGPVKTSMWQDIEAGHRTEVDYLHGYVAKQADSLGLRAPVNRMLTTLVHAIENRAVSL